MTQWTRENSRAFMPYPDCDVAHTEDGPLAGLTFSVKDMFDVAGFPTSAGSPTMLAVSGIKQKLLVPCNSFWTPVLVSSAKR